MIADRPQTRFRNQASVAGRHSSMQTCQRIGGTFSIEWCHHRLSSTHQDPVDSGCSLAGCDAVGPGPVLTYMYPRSYYAQDILTAWYLSNLHSLWLCSTLLFHSGHSCGSTFTVPRSPSTSSMSPDLICWVASPTPSTAGMPYSRATMEPWARMLPMSVTSAVAWGNS